MSGILFLGNDDFQVRQGDQGLLLSLNSDFRGLVLVLFYSKECPYCDNLINKFKQLPNVVNGCLFAMVNVNRNMLVVEKSKDTIAPITYVPDVILYINGIPYMRYDGAHELDSIKEFLLNVYQKIQKPIFVDNGNATQKLNATQSSSPQQQPQQHNNKPAPTPIPAYTIGRPTCGDWKKDGVCYLNFQKAYSS